MIEGGPFHAIAGVRDGNDLKSVIADGIFTCGANPYTSE